MASSEMHLTFETDIRASADSVFGLLIDLANYGRWLPSSSAFHGTTEISDDPIKIGTTYVERGPTGVRRGRVTEFEPPSRVTFEQPMVMKPRGSGVVDIQVAIELTPAADAVHLKRTVSLSFTGPVRFARALVRRAIETENARMMAAMKQYAEGQTSG